MPMPKAMVATITGTTAFVQSPWMRSLSGAGILAW
jgi:hypothetical protein